MAPRWVVASVVAHVALVALFVRTNGPWRPYVPKRSLSYLLDLRGLPPEPAASRLTFDRPPPARRGAGLAVRQRTVTSRDTMPGQPNGLATGDTAGTSPAGLPAGHGLSALTPRYADSRLWVRPLLIPEEGGRPLSLDSVTRAWFQMMADSIARHPEMSPNYNPYVSRPWTFTRNGRTYGIDASGFHLGSFTIPTAVLAFLALPQGNIDQARANAALMNMRADMLRAAARAQTEEDFRRAVREIRERNDRERRERRERQGNRPPTTP